MKMRKMLSLILMVCLVISMSATAMATGSPFKDVSMRDYYYESIVDMSNDGILCGKGNGIFDPQGAVTHAEALKIIFGVANINYGQADSGGEWYYPIAKYAENNGISTPGTNYDAAAKRSEICNYIIKTFNLQTPVKYRVFNDVHTDTEKNISNIMYHYGIIAGIPNRDGTLSFGGNQNVIRGDACIMLSRAKNKILGYVEKPNSVNRPVATLPSSLFNKTTVEDFIPYWEYMMENDLFRYDVGQIEFSRELNYDEYVAVRENVKRAYYLAIKNYPLKQTFHYGKAGIRVHSYGEYNMTTKIDLIIYVDSPDITCWDEWENKIRNDYARVKDYAPQLVQGLYNRGEISNSMSNKQKANILYKYMINNFDINRDVFGKNDNAYTNFVENSCNKYTFAQDYCYLCKMCGVDMEVSYWVYGNGRSGVWIPCIKENGVYHYCNIVFDEPTVYTKECEVSNYTRPNSSFWLTADKLSQGGKLVDEGIY